MPIVTDQDLTDLQKIYFEEISKLEEYRKVEQPEKEYDFTVLTIRLEMRMVVNTRRNEK